MKKNRLTLGVFDSFGKKQIAFHFDYSGYEGLACEGSSDFNYCEDDLVRINKKLSMIVVVDDMPFNLPDIFFRNVVELKMLCHLSAGDVYCINKHSRDYRKEAGECLIRLQDILAEHGLPWTTLWNHNLVPVSLSTAKRYKALARKKEKLKIVC